MSREVFELADPDGEDYFNFGEQQHKSAPVSSSSRNKVQSRPARSRPHTFNLGADSDNEGEDIIDYLDLPQAPSEPDPAPARKGKKSTAAPARRVVHDYMSPDNGEQQEPARKIPTKSVAEHQTLMLTLQRYAASERFAPVLRDAGLKLTNLDSKTVAELKTLQIRVRTICSSGGSSTGLLSNMILGGSAVVESRMPKKIMDLDGFSSSLSTDPEFAAICEMLELDMGFASAMTPMQRMGMCLGKHAVKVNGINKSRDEMLKKLTNQMQQQQQFYQPAQQVVPPPVMAQAPIVPHILPTFESAAQPIRSRAMPMYD
jgi:hypothetical protein